MIESNSFFDSKTIAKINDLDNKNCLLTISGGVDSVVLFHILIENGITFCAAHVNYKLRGKDSDKDEQFVEELCALHKVTLYKKTIALQSKKGTSIQLKARELRYKWFYELMKSNSFDKLITAHHLSDQLETFLINLSRGSGLKGLCGISDKKIARPLLQMKKEKIIAFAKEKKIVWREDKSNQESKYLRNFIRSEIIPEMQKIHPTFMDNFSKTLSNLNAEFDFLEKTYQSKLKEVTIENTENSITLDLNLIKNLNHKETLFHSWFKDFGFSKATEIIKLLEAENGKELKSNTHRLLIYNEKLILATKEKKQIDSIKIKNLLTLKELKWAYSIDDFIAPSASASFDYKKITFPLTLNGLQKGDSFFPLGMKGSKKVSKYMRDAKNNKLEKEGLKILRNFNGEIIWLVNERIDNRYKALKNSESILNIYL